MHVTAHLHCVSPQLGHIPARAQLQLVQWQLVGPCCLLPQCVKESSRPQQAGQVQRTCESWRAGRHMSEREMHACHVRQLQTEKTMFSMHVQWSAGLVIVEAGIEGGSECPLALYSQPLLFYIVERRYTEARF